MKMFGCIYFADDVIIAVRPIMHTVCKLISQKCVSSSEFTNWIQHFYEYSITFA